MKRQILLCGFLFFSIEIYSQQIVRSNLFGFTTTNMFTFFDMKDTSFTDQIKAIYPQVFRFPGGSLVGNFYHVNKEGYGFDINEIDNWNINKFSKRSRGLLRAMNKKNHQKDYINDLLTISAITNSDVVLVANILSGGDDVLYMINKLKEHNIRVVGVELGCELYNRVFLNNMDEKKYILLAKDYSERIKSRFPDIKTAVIAAPLVKKSNHRHRVWNQAISELDFYDAIVVHSYAKVIKGVDQYGEMLTEEYEGKKSKAFNIYKKRVLSYFSESYVKEIMVYEKIFNKPIWITEWNLQISKTTGNTLLQGLFVAQYLLELTTSSKLNNIEIATFHNLAGRDLSGSIFQNKLDTNYRHSTYIPMKMVGKIFSNSSLGGKQAKVSDECFEYIFSDSLGIDVIRCWINWSDNEKIIISNDKARYSLNEYFGSNLYNTNDMKGSIIHKESLSNKSSNIRLRPYSITLWELER